MTRHDPASARIAVMSVARIRLILALLLTAMFAIPSHGRDPGALERELGERLEERGYTGELLRLGAAGGGFLTLLERSAGSSVRRAAIMVHGMGQHLDWPDVVSPLRNHLPEFGWSTLSVQCPLLSPLATRSLQADQARVALARIHAARNYLVEQGTEQLAIIGYGQGAALVANYLASRQQDVAAAVLISMQAPPYMQPLLDPVRDVARLTVPLLDVYASNDSMMVLEAAAIRQPATLKGAPGGLDQLVIAGADHNYHGYESIMTRAIANWLDATVDKPEDTVPAATASPPARP